MSVSQDGYQQFRDFAASALSLSLRMNESDPHQRKIVLKLLELSLLMRRVKVDVQAQLPLIDVKPSVPVAKTEKTR